MDWTNAEAPSLDDIETLARDCFSELPESFRALAGDITFMVQDFPDVVVIEEMELETPFDILGLFQGPNLAERDHASGQNTMIFLYRRPILDYWAENADPLGVIIRHVLIHEIGHHFGLSDEAMEAIEEQD
ncbi:MAG: metallopeptidase family protein [Alphaproteobacteria bacterium]|nr:metallopeptidase family protein [Alphaproteobacteria bacterium]